MSAPDRNTPLGQNPTRIVWIVVGVVAVLILAGIVIFRRQSPATAPVESARLPNAIRPGSPEFEQYKQQIVLDKPVADEAKRALGDIVMTLRSTVRNFTGRTINGLEIRAAVVNMEGKPIKERTVVYIPTRYPELEPNKTLPVAITLEGFKDSDERADIQMEITGFTFK
jgi:hypothetical protein